MKFPDASVAITAAEISAAVDRLAGEIDAFCADGEWIAVCVLNGGLMFTSELMKRVRVSMQLDSIRVTRYHNTTRGKNLNWHALPETTIEGQSIILIDDIFDEGETLAALDGWFRERGAREVLSVVLVDKAHDRKVRDFAPDLVGLTCEDAYVFGFGMDYEGYFRNLPDIYRLNR